MGGASAWDQSERYTYVKFIDAYIYVYLYKLSQIATYIKSGLVR